MEYLKNRSRGTDDDISNQDIICNSKGVMMSGAMRIPSGPLSRVIDISEMELQIHCIETAAYGAVLKAFIAQSDVLSWGKEGLISELRKELRVSDVEHREILGKVNSDNSIKTIRERLKSTDVQQVMLTTTMNTPGFAPISVGHVPRKKLKPGHITVSSSPKYLSRAQPSPAVISSLAPHVRDYQWGSNVAAISPHGNVGQATVAVPQSRQALSTGKGRESLIVRNSKKGFVYSGVENSKAACDKIAIRATDKLIHEVERVCGGENPDPAQVEKAKLILREHERALLEAIDKLADVSDDDDSPDQRLPPYSNEELQRDGRGFHTAVSEQVDRTGGYYSEVYGRYHAERAGIPYIDLQDDEYNEGNLDAMIFRPI